MSLPLWHLGLVAPNYGAGVSAGGLTTAAIAAEQVGFDALWVTDHVAVPSEQSQTYGSISEALVTAAYLAARTTRIDIGISALVIPQRPLLLTLKQVMSLQLLAEGRLIIALAAGWTEQEFRNLGASMRDRSANLGRWEALVDAVEVGGGGRMDMRLGDLEIVDAVIAPGFFNGAPPPAWMAGHAAAVIRRAARSGVWHPVGRPVSIIEPLARDLRVLRPGAHVVLRVGVTFENRAHRDALDAGGRCRLIGPPSFIAEQLGRFRDAGCDGFVVDLMSGADALEDRIERFWCDIAPYIGQNQSDRSQRAQGHREGK